MSSRNCCVLISQLLFCSFSCKRTAKLFLFCFFSYGICAQPVINSLSPLSGSTGSTVTISGSNFDPVAANNIVYFGAVKANIISASATVLTVSVPAGASYEPVTVTTSTLTAISAKPFTVTFGCAASANLSASSFVRYTINDGGNYSIMNADMDGEGKPDIICSNGSSIIILLNKSTLNTVSFASGKIIAAKCCFKFDIADVDGDGKLDLIIPNVCNNLVSIMKNNSATGSLSFASAMDYVTGDYPYAVAVSNIDGDGKPDLAVVNMEGNTLSVFRNASTNGVISFVNKIDYPTGAECRDVAIADIDGDGKQDIAVTSQSDQYFSLFKNLSTANTIVLSAKQDFSTSPSNPEDIAIADFDGDGKSDIAVSNNNTAGNISVFKNLSIPGSFSFAPRKDFLTGAYPFRMAAADLNGDGRPDLAVKDQYTSTLTLLENNSSTGNISFASKIDLPARSPERQHLTVGDFNGDGKPEIAVTDGTNIFIFLNPAILSISASYTIPTCSEYDGTITAIALGGQAPYEYKIGTLPYQGSGNFTKLPPGTHLVRVKDASGCVDSLTVVLPSNYLWFTTSVRDANCNQNNGSISISGGGTNLPLTYSLNGINFQSTPQFNNLAPGIYNVYVKDNGGCMNQTGFTIGSRCMTITPTVTKTTCGFGNGIIEVQASGGVSPYQYSLDGVQYVSNNRFTNLTPKDYTVYVKDASGNTASGTVTVSNIAGPILSAVDITSTDCNSNTGTATIIPQGGSAPFQYVLNAVTFQSNPTFSSLAPGSYKLTVNDANGCFDSRTIEIPVNNNLTIDMGQDLTVCETAKVTFAGRSNGTSFSWSPSTALNSSSILSPVASPSTTTTYIVTASLGACTSKDTIIVNLRPAPVPNAGTDITICPGQTTVLKGSGGIFLFMVTFSLSF